jgi:glycosyltransferase involved in cell wall biosynthesis
MRVLIASHSGGLRGGAERCVLELACALQVDGRVQPIVTAPTRGELTDGLQAAGVEYAFATAPPWLVDQSPPWPADPFRGARRVKRVFSAARASSPWLARLRELAPDVVVSSTTTSPAPALASRRAGIPHVWWVHEFTTRGLSRRYALGEALSQRAIGWLSERVVVHAPAVAEHYAPPIERSKISVVELGIEPGCVERNDVVPGRVRLLLLGRKSPAKGCELAIHAIAALRQADVDVLLRMVGPSVPGYAMQLWDLASSLGVTDNVRFVEYEPNPERHLTWCNAMLMCAEGEAFGRVTVEALKSGRPVIGVRDGSTGDLLVPERNGLLFDPGDVDGLATAIRRCADDPALVRLMSKNAVASMEGRFTMAGEVDAFVAAFRAAAAGKPA